MPRFAPSGNGSRNGEVPRSAPSAANSGWIDGDVLEDMLDIQTPEKMKEIAWLTQPPVVGRSRDASPTAIVIVDQKAVLCKLLGIGASRVVYSVGRRYAIKYEYGDPEGHGSNKKEASIALQFPQMLPWTIRLSNGCLLARQAPYTLEHLISDVSDFSVALSKMGEGSPPSTKEQFMNYRRLLKGAVEWAVWLVDFAVLNGVRLKDASPRNTGFEPVEGK